MDRSASKPVPDNSHDIAMEPPAGRRSSRRNGSVQTRVSAKVEVEGGGIHVERRFTKEGVHPFDEVTWETRTAAIGNEKGETVFEQKDCEIPTFWSQMATNVVVSKYFRGKLGTPGRETSVKQMISRVSDTIGKWGREGGYFATETDASAFQDELTHLLLHQKMSFNSPVWFNLGVATSKPQISACQPYDARVATPTGLIPIGELVDRNEVGKEVFDRAGVTRIVATKANGRKEVFRLTIGSGVTIDATADHVILVADDRKGHRTSWKRVSEVKTGDRLVLDASRTVMRPAEVSVMELAGSAPLAITQVVVADSSSRAMSRVGSNRHRANRISSLQRRQPSPDGCRVMAMSGSPPVARLSSSNCNPPMRKSWRMSSGCWTSSSRAFTGTSAVPTLRRTAGATASGFQAKSSSPLSISGN